MIKKIFGRFKIPLGFLLIRKTKDRQKIDKRSVFSK